MKVFLAGIIQGSKKSETVHSQDYRTRLKSLLKSKCSGIELVDPFDGHEGSIDYDDAKAYEVFFGHINQIDSCDLLIAFLPEASMGTAVEMTEAFQKNIPIITVSPMTINWVIRLFSWKNFETVEKFEKFIDNNNFERSISEYSSNAEEKV